jgi:coenzyme F420-reducing hydrogenase alpha subunit
VVLRALRMKKVAGDLCAAICGRHTHPVGMTVGGFSHFPDEEQLLELKERLVAMRADVDITVDLFQGLKFPSFERDTEYIALSKEDEYCFIDGIIKSTDGGSWPIEDYRSITNEYQELHSSAKHARHQRLSYMVGALARFNVNYDQLHSRAKATANALNLKPKCTNPYLNTAAQVVEIVHCLEDSIQIIDRLVEAGVQWEDPAPPRRFSGTGAGACEAPRGILFHEYSIKGGYVTEANCIIPTGQNLANIEADMRSLVPTIMDKPKEHISQQLEMLVRAYDPCISCSTHMVEVKFV